MLRQDLGLLEHGSRRLLLLVRWVAVLAEDALDEDPQLRPDVVADGPVNRDVCADGAAGEKLTDGSTATNS